MPSECCEKQCLTLFHWKLSAFSRVNVENFVAQCEVLSSVDLSGSQRLFSTRLGQTSWAEWLVLQPSGWCNVSICFRCYQVRKFEQLPACEFLFSLALLLTLCLSLPLSVSSSQKVVLLSNQSFFLYHHCFSVFLKCIWECCFCMHCTKWRFKQFGRLNLEMPRAMQLRPIATGNDDRHRWCRVSQIRNLMLNDGRWSYSYSLFISVCFWAHPRWATAFTTFETNNLQLIITWLWSSTFALNQSVGAEQCRGESKHEAFLT